MKRSWFPWALGAALVAVAVALFLALFERVEEEVETGPRAAANANDYLAAERLLAALGVDARSVRGPVRMPPPDHVLVLVTPRRIFGEAQVEELLAWVARGGHLVTAPRPPAAEGEAESEDLLLARLGLPLVPGEATEAEVLAVPAAGDAAPLRVEVGAPRFGPAGDDADFAAAGVLVRYRWQQGWVTVLADASFLTNERIGDHEHARFLWSLVTVPRRPAGVWLVYRDRLPGLSRLLAERAWTALVSAALLLAAWLWMRGARFGPALPPPPAARRSLREHLAATAEFLWRQGHGEALVAGERRAVLHAAARQHPAWLELPPRDRIRYLAELAGVTGGAVGRALEGEVDGDPAAWTRMVATLEKVRRSL